MPTAGDKVLASADFKINVVLDKIEPIVRDVSLMFEECLQEIYKGSYPDITFTIYVTYPKYDNVGNARSMFHLRVSSNSADEVGFKNKVKDARTPVIDCVNNKLSVYRKSQPDNYSFVFGHAGTLINQSESVFDLDKSQFLETIESSLRNNLYGRFIAKSGQVGKIVFYTTSILNNITDKSIIELVQCIFPDYDEGSIERFILENGKKLIELIKNIIKELQ